MNLVRSTHSGQTEVYPTTAIFQGGRHAKVREGHQKKEEETGCQTLDQAYQGALSPILFNEARIDDLVVILSEAKDLPLNWDDPSRRRQGAWETAEGLPG